MLLMAQKLLLISFSLPSSLNQLGKKQPSSVLMSKGENLLHSSQSKKKGLEEGETFIKIPDLMDYKRKHIHALRVIRRSENSCWHNFCSSINHST